MKRFATIVLLTSICATGFGQRLAPLGTRLMMQYEKLAVDDKIPVWIYFTDKGAGAEQRLSMLPETFLTPRAIARRERMMHTENADANNNLLGMEDVPLEPTYVASVANIVTKVRQEVKWFNSMSVVATKEQIAALRLLPHVKEIELIPQRKPRKWELNSALDPAAPPSSSPQAFLLLNYGNSLGQNQQISTVSLHNQGINGAGVFIAVFDAGFSNLTHPALATRTIAARYDFVAKSSTFARTHSHGQNTFSVVGGFSEGNLVGPAYGASFALARTEEDTLASLPERPMEEDNWARAVIWADSLGVDVISSSLGYNDFEPGWPDYTWQDMNGVNTVITRAANRATQLGIVVVNSAGNDGDAGAGQNSLGAPADGFDVITAGSVTSSGDRSGFSSTGPTADGRIKPDVMAQGSNTWAATGTSGYGGVSGTSFSCPMTAGAAALVLSANLSAGLTPKQVAEAMRQTASRANTPDRFFGWGIVNTAKAAHYVWMEHTLPGNTSDTTTRSLLVRIKSRIGLTQDSARVWYGINGSFTNSALLQRQGATDTYRADIPFLGRNVNVTYYFRARNDSVAVRYPLGTAFFSYQVNSDVAGPTITHTQRGNIAITSWPPRLTATVTDISNPIGVSIEYKYNGTVQPTINVTSADSVYSDTLRIAQGLLRDNDLIEYRFKAVDGIGTISYSPTSGYAQFRVKNYSHVQNSFESNNANFTGTNDWEYGARAGTSPVPYGGTKYWATKLNGNYTTGPRLSSLTTPTYSVFSSKASFSFYNWYEAESRFDGGNVKVSVNGGAFQVVNPVGGYPIASIYNGFSNPLAGQPGYAETGGARWAKAAFDLTGIANESNTIAIRFDFGADNNGVVYRGWYIDDFFSDGFGTAGPLGVDEQSNVQRQFELEQNYPNPFNPTTTIRFSLTTSGFTTLKVFDVLGREVATLVSEETNAGVHQVRLDASKLSSGTYFYKLQSGNNVAVKKLVLMK